MTTRTTAGRILAEDMREIITRALQPGDYEHDTAWIDDHAVEVPTPPARIMTPGILVSALPEPGPDGTVGTREAALSVLSVIEQRLAPFPYTLRAHHLVQRLTEVSEEYETAHGAPAGAGVPAAADSRMPRCGYCGEPCKHKLARYCTPSHRQQAYKKRKRG